MIEITTNNSMSVNAAFQEYCCRFIVSFSEGLPPLKFWAKPGDWFDQRLKVDGLFGKGLLTFHAQTETEDGPCRVLFVPLGGLSTEDTRQEYSSKDFDPQGENPYPIRPTQLPRRGMKAGYTDDLGSSMSGFLIRAQSGTIPDTSSASIIRYQGSQALPHWTKLRNVNEVVFFDSPLSELIEF